jgi:hypothetical protein
MGLGRITRAATGLMILAGLAATVMGCKDKEISVRADFNHDGVRDTLMHMEESENHGIYLDLSNNGSSTRVAILDHEPQYLGAEFFDEDNNLDITYRVYEGSGMLNGDGTYVLRGNGDGTFQDKIEIKPQSKLYSFGPRR